MDFGENAGSDCPLTVGDVSSLKAEVLVMTNCLVRVRGGDLSRLAPVPRDGRGKAKDKGIIR